MCNISRIVLLFHVKKAILLYGRHIQTVFYEYIVQIVKALKFFIGNLEIQTEKKKQYLSANN